MAEFRGMQCAFCALLLLALLSACARGGALPATDGMPALPAAFAGLELPTPAQLSRSSSPPQGSHEASATPASITLLGKDYRSDLSSNRVVLDGDLLTISSGFTAQSGVGGLGYALYSFDTPDPVRVPELRLIWDTPPADPANVYIGVANFDRNRWDWPAVEHEESNGIQRDRASLSAWTPYLAPSDGKLYVAALLIGSEFAKLRKLRAGEPYMYGMELHPRSGYAPLTVTCGLFYAGMPGSQITGLAMDFNADGQKDAEQYYADYIYNLPGTYPVTGTVINDEGLSASETYNVYVLNGDWETQPLAVPEGPKVSKRLPKAAQVNFRPAVAYLREVAADVVTDPPTSRVEYMIAADELATSWLGPYTVYEDPTARPVAVGGILDVEGRPGILVQTEGGILFFIKGDAAVPSSWTEPKLIAGSLTEESGIACGLTVGNPFVVYTFPTPFIGWTAWYARANEPSAEGDWTDGIVGEGKCDVSLYNGAAGVPEVATHLVLSNEVAIYRAEDFTGVSANVWAEAKRVPASAATPGAGPLAAYPGFLDGFFLAGTDAADASKGYVQAFDAGATVEEHSLGEADSWFDLESYILGRNLCYCAYDKEAGDLLFNYYLNIDGSLYFGSEQSVDSAGDVGAHCSFTQALGIPIIVYEDADNRAVKVARLN